MAALEPLLRRPRARDGDARAAAIAASHAARLVRQCSTPADLRAVISEHGHEFDARALAAAAARAGAVCQPPSGAAVAERLLDRLVPRLLEALAAGAPLGAREISKVLISISEVGYPLQQRELDVLIGALLPQVPGAAPADLATAAEAAARAAPGREDVWAALEAAAAAAIRRAPPYSPAAPTRPGDEAAEAAGGAGDARPDGGRRARRRGPHGAVPALFTGPEAMRLALAAAGGRAASEASSVARLAAAHAVAGRAPAAVAGALAEWLEAAGCLPQLAPSELSALVAVADKWSLGEGAARRLLDAAADRLWQFSGRELDELVAAAARMGVQHVPLQAALAKQLDNPEAAAGASPATLAAALRAAARAGGDGGRELLRAAAAAMAAAPGAFSPGDAAGAVWAAAAMGLRDDAFYAAALGRLAACAGECSPQEVAQALLGACASGDAAARARLIAAALPAAARRAGEASARDAAAALRVAAAAERAGELEAAGDRGALRGAAEALGGAVVRQWREGTVPRGIAEDVAASLQVLCGADHPVVVELHTRSKEQQPHQQQDQQDQQQQQQQQP